MVVYPAYNSDTNKLNCESTLRKMRAAGSAYAGYGASPVKPQTGDVMNTPILNYSGAAHSSIRRIL